MSNPQKFLTLIFFVVCFSPWLYVPARLIVLFRTTWIRLAFYLFICRFTRCELMAVSRASIARAVLVPSGKIAYTVRTSVLPTPLFCNKRCTLSCIVLIRRYKNGSVWPFEIPSASAVSCEIRLFIRKVINRSGLRTTRAVCTRFSETLFMFEPRTFFAAQCRRKRFKTKESYFRDTAAWNRVVRRLKLKVV